MPVTIKLSQKLNEKLLREGNEVNFGRFDAKLEQRLGALDATWGGRWTELDAKLEQRIAALRTEMQTGLATLKGELVAEMGKLRGDMTAAIARTQSATVKWMFGFWAPTAVGIVATAAGVVALLLRR